MGKKLVIACLIALPFLVFLFVCTRQTSTIDNLLVHFEHSGLSVPPPLGGKEKATVEKTRKTLKRLGARSKSKLVESRTMMIDSVKVTIRRYQNASAAQIEYENHIKKEERRKQQARERNTPYHKNTYFLNGALILQIHHSTVRSLDQSRLTKVDVFMASVEKIERALNNF